MQRLRDTVLTFTGCEQLRSECTSADARVSEVKTAELAGALGWESKAKKERRLWTAPR
jgi:hypothetical protein